VDFLATFDKDPFTTGVFVKSTNDKYRNQPWKLVAGGEDGGLEGDNALVAEVKAKHYGISAVFSKPIELGEEDDFVVQYEVQLRDGLECGGAYLKVLDAGANISPQVRGTASVLCMCCVLYVSCTSRTRMVWVLCGSLTQPMHVLACDPGSRTWTLPRHTSSCSGRTAAGPPTRCTSSSATRTPFLGCGRRSTPKTPPPSRVVGVPSPQLSRSRLRSPTSNPNFLLTRGGSASCRRCVYVCVYLSCADKLPHLYTLVIRKDNTFSILIDGDSVKEGSLLEDMAPPVNPPKVCWWDGGSMGGCARCGL
jgi:hypothetical protein